MILPLSFHLHPPAICASMEITKPWMAIEMSNRPVQKTSKQDSQMGSAAFVADADRKLRWMVRHETRFPGDTKQAMRRLADRYEISYSALYTLRYRSPNDILLSVYLSICSAYEAEVSRQEKAFEHEKAIAKAKTGLGAALLRLADTLDRPQAGAVDDGAQR